MERQAMARGTVLIGTPRARRAAWRGREATLTYNISEFNDWAYVRWAGNTRSDYVRLSEIDHKSRHREW